MIGNVNPSYPFNTTNIKSLVRTEFGETCPAWFEDVVALELSSTQIQVQGTLHAEAGSNFTNVKLFGSLITTNVDPYAAPNGEDHISEPFRDHGWHATQGISVTATPDAPQEFSVIMNKLGSWAREDLEVALWIQNISSKDIQQGYITNISSEFAFMTTNDNPVQSIIQPSAGEMAYLVELNNVGTMDDEYTLTLACDWPAGWAYSVGEDGGVSDPTSIPVSLGSGESTFIIVRANPSTYAGSANMSLVIESSNSDLITQTLSWRLMAGLDVLVIDADGGETFETYYANALADADMPVVWGWWDTALDEADPALFEGVDALVWFTGNLWQETLTPLDQLNLQDYLDMGGNLFMTGQGMGFDMRNDQFFSDYVHADYNLNFSIGSSVTGLEGTPAEGLAFGLVGGDGANNQNRQSSISALEGANLIFNYDQEYQGNTQGAGVTVDNGTYKLVYLGFGFEAISSAEDRTAMMTTAISWLLGLTATPEFPVAAPAEFSLMQNYPNPFNPETNIPFALPVRSNVTLKVYDLLGREVATLANGAFEAGLHTVNLNGSDLSSGVYFYTIKADGGSESFTSTRKLVLMK
ncbi:MAG: T9SS type A sorting domain-containing protein [bacterium]|nr:T9SS type A sorting domain-containing protein [bacterium]